MNSLQDLNGYSDDRVAHNDTRTRTVIWDRTSPINQEITANEGSLITSTEGINITEIVNMSDYNDVIYEFDVSAFPDPANLTVNYTVPSGVTFTKTGNNYKFGNLQTKSDWDAVKNPGIVLPRDYSGTLIFFPRVHWNGNTNGFTWQTTVNVIEYPEMSEPVGPITFTVGANIKVTGTPQILDEENPDNQFNVYNMTITSSSPNYTFPGVLQAFSSGGGTATWNAGSGNLVITGSKTQANVFLNNLYYTANVSGLDEDFYLNYTLKNPGSGFVTTKQQFFQNSNIAIMTRPTAHTYEEDVGFTVTGFPQITETYYTGSGNYTTVIQGNTSAYQRIWANTGGGSVSWNSTTKALTITANKSSTNTRLSNIFIQPAVDFSTNWQLNYTVNTPGGLTASRPQTMLIGQTNDEITNLQHTRYFVKNRGGLLFPNLVPQIDETVAGNPTYTISIYSPYGRMAQNANSTSTGYVLNLSNTKANINATIGNIYFWPNKNVFGLIPIYYTQLRSGSVQINNQVINAVGADNLDPPDGVGLQTFTSSQTWSPTISQSMYLTANILAVGGGSASNGLNGGSAGGVFQANNVVIPENTTWNITVGAGGSSKGADGGATSIELSQSGLSLTVQGSPSFFDQMFTNYGNVGVGDFSGQGRWSFFSSIPFGITAFNGVAPNSGAGGHFELSTPRSRAGGISFGREDQGGHWGKFNVTRNPVKTARWEDFSQWRDGGINPAALSWSGTDYVNSNVGGIYGSITSAPNRLIVGALGHGAGGYSLRTSFPDDPSAFFGNGGPGISSNITGSVVVYGCGGATTSNVCLPFQVCRIQTNVTGGSGGAGGGNINQAGITYGTGGGCANVTTGFYPGQQGVVYIRTTF